MAHAKKGALHQVLVPMVDATDFNSIESAITASDFNSGATVKFYGWDTGVSTATTSGTVSKTASLVRSGVFRITLKTTENNYDGMMLRVNKTGCAEQIMMWSNVNNDDSDIMSFLSNMHSDIGSQLGNITLSASNVSDIASAIIAGLTTVDGASLISDIASAVRANLASDISDILSGTTQINSRALVNQSRVSDVYSLLSDLDSNFQSRVPKAVATNSQLSDLHSDLRSYVVGISASVSDLQSALSDAHSDLASKIGAITVTISASDVSDIASAVVAALPITSTVSDIYSLLSDLNSNFHSRIPKEPSARSQLSDLASDLLSNLLVAQSMASDAASAAQQGSSRALINQSRISDVQSYLVALSGALSDVESQIDAGIELGASSLSDIRSAITAAEFDASDISDIASAVWARALVAPTAAIGATPTTSEALAWLATMSRNRLSQTSTKGTLYADNGTTVVASSVDSDDGTTTTRGEWG